MMKHQTVPDKRENYTSSKPKTVLKDYLTAVDVNLVLNLPTPILRFLPPEGPAVMFTAERRSRRGCHQNFIRFACSN